MASVRVGVGLGVAVGTSGAVGSTWQASRSRAPRANRNGHRENLRMHWFLSGRSIAEPGWCRSLGGGPAGGYCLEVHHSSSR